MWVYDVRGRLKRKALFSGLRPGGVSDLDWDLSGLPAGVYFEKYKAGIAEGSRRVVVSGRLVRNPLSPFDPRTIRRSLADRLWCTTGVTFASFRIEDECLGHI